MKFIHTADWHLGKSLKNQSLIEDQNYILQEFLKLVDAENPDAVVIAGDIYDRNIPPIDAVELFNETLNKLVEQKLPTLIISGNHDSAARLNFGSKIFERQNIFIATKISDEPARVVLEDEFGENAKVSYKVTKKESMDEEKLDDCVDRYKNSYDAEVNVTSGYELDIELVIKGGDASSYDDDDTEMTFEVVKADGKWVLYDMK